MNRNRAKTGNQLARQCWDLLRQNTEWMKIPLLSTVGVIIVTIIFGILALIVFALSGGSSSSSQSDSASTIQGVGGIIFLFLYYFAMNSIIVYCETALVSVVLMKLRGENANPKAADGFAVANKRMGAIIGYAALSATVGVIARMITDSGRRSRNLVIMLLAMLLAGILQASWTIMTLMVTPVISAENVGVSTAIQRSWALFKQTWGEMIMGRFSLGFFGCLLTLGAAVPGVIILALGGVINSPAILITGFGVLMIGVLLISLLTSATFGIFKAVLYQYATAGNMGGILDENLVKELFVAKA